MALMRRDHGTRLFDPLEQSMLEWPLRPLEALRRLVDEDLIKVDEFMEDNELVVRAEVPGVDPERDVDDSIVDGALSIRAERRQAQRGEVVDMRPRRTALRHLLPHDSLAGERDAGERERK